MTTTDDADLLAALEQATDPRDSPVATPADVADHLPIGAEATRQRLSKLADAADDDAGDVRTRKVGRSRVFWLLPDRDAPNLEATDYDLTIADIDTPPLSSRDEFEAAARAIISHTREVGEITRQQAQDELHDEHPAGYLTNERTWWRRVAKPVLKAHPDIRQPPAGGSKHRYTGE